MSTTISGWTALANFGIDKHIWRLCLRKPKCSQVWEGDKGFISDLSPLPSVGSQQIKNKSEQSHENCNM
jgi:hypothetical protein